VFTVTFIRQ